MWVWKGEGGGGEGDIGLWVGCMYVCGWSVVPVAAQNAYIDIFYLLRHSDAKDELFLKWMRRSR